MSVVRHWLEKWVADSITAGVQRQKRKQEHPLDSADPPGTPNEGWREPSPWFRDSFLSHLEALMHQASNKVEKLSPSAPSGGWDVACPMRWLWL